MPAKFEFWTCCSFHYAANPAWIELLSICKHVLGLRGSVAQASLLDELGLQPLQIIWLKACAKFFATACTASRGNPLLLVAMRANVELSKDCHKAWCARLAWFLKCISVLSCEEICATRPIWAWWLKPFCIGLGAAGNNSYTRV
jgi:hypothetical protein